MYWTGGVVGTVGVVVGAVGVGVTAPTVVALGAEAPPAAAAAECPDAAFAGAAQAAQARNVAPSTLIDPIRTETSFVGLRG
jgi:hypothetical protein